MTNKEALEALLNGEKITTEGWLENSKIKGIAKMKTPKYICFDFDEDQISDENGNAVYLDTRKEGVYQIYKEPSHSLLTPFEKRFIREWGKALNCSYSSLRLVIDNSNYNYVHIRLFSIDSDLSFTFNLKHISYEFRGLKRNKEYTWYELDVWSDD